MVISAYGAPQGIDDSLCCVPPDEARLILSHSWKEMSLAELSLLLEQTPPVSLVFLPAAIAYVKDKREAYGQVAENVVWCVHRSEAELRQLGIMQPIAMELQEVFWVWVAGYTCRPVADIPIREDGSVMLWACVEGSEERDDYLSILCRKVITCEGVGLADALLSKLVECPPTVASSAHLLDLVYRSMCSGYRCGLDFRVYHHPVIAALIGDKSMLRQHWRIARRLIIQEAPEAYVTSLQSTLRELWR